MSGLLRQVWFAGLLFPFATMTSSAFAADLDYPDAPPPPPPYERHVIEEPPVVVERPAPYAEPYADRSEYDARPIDARPAPPQPYDDDIPYVEGPRPPGYVPY